MKTTIKCHAPEHDHRYEAAAIKAERQDVANNPTPMKAQPASIYCKGGVVHKVILKQTR